MARRRAAVARQALLRLVGGDDGAAGAPDEADAAERSDEAGAGERRVLDGAEPVAALPAHAVRSPERTPERTAERTPERRKHVDLSEHLVERDQPERKPFVVTKRVPVDLPEAFATAGGGDAVAPPGPPPPPSSCGGACTPCSTTAAPARARGRPRRTAARRAAPPPCPCNTAPAPRAPRAGAEKLLDHRWIGERTLFLFVNHVA